MRGRTSVGVHGARGPRERVVLVARGVRQVAEDVRLRGGLALRGKRRALAEREHRELAQFRDLALDLEERRQLERVAALCRVRLKKDAAATELLVLLG